MYRALPLTCVKLPYERKKNSKREQRVINTHMQMTLFDRSGWEKRLPGSTAAFLKLKRALFHIWTLHKSHRAREC